MDKRKLYEVYKNNPKTGDKILIGQLLANTPGEALNLAYYEFNTRFKANNNYLVIPHKTRAQFSFHIPAGWKPGNGKKLK